MKRKVLVIVLALLVVLISMSLFACKPEGANGQVPIYQGMTISNNGIINNLSSRMAPNENSSDVAQYIHGDHTGRDEDVDQETPFDNVPTIEEKAESTLVVNGSGAEIYYASKNQDIYITIKVLNPDSYEIVSFTLNGNKYTSYMFEAGSDLENLILKLNVGDAAGIVDYTIDAIKYIDGTEIKDVLIEGEKTVKAGVRADDQTYVNVTNNVSTLNTISFNATLVDLYDLIAKSNGYAKAVLYDGVSVVSTKDLTAGENSIVFDSLVPNKLYQYGITVLYDNLSGDGIQLNTIYTYATYTKTIVLFDNMSVSQTDISFDYLWEETFENKTITNLALYRGGEEVKALSSTAPLISNLLSNVEYEIRASYLNLNQESETISVFFTTVSKATPAISIITPDSTQTALSYEITETDTDAVGAITKIELLHGTDTPVEAANIETRTFTELLSNNAYTVKVTYTYNLNDGTGDKVISREQEITTVSKATPVISIITPDSTQTALSYEITETDTDAVGAITKIELLHGTDTPVEAANIETRTFTELLSNNAYTVKVTYTYNLNDGTGDKIITREQEITTVSKATPAISIINPNSTQTDLSYEITETDTDAVGAITKIELLHGTDTPVEAATLETRTFTELLSNNAYTVKVTYTYNLNDGTGDKIITIEQEITTVSKATPVISIITPDSTQTALSYEITETDTDAVGAITKIELLHGADAPVEAATLETRTFTELLSNNAYTVKVTYTYNLNDGTGDKIITREQEITTVSKATPAISIINPDSTQTALSYEITETDTDAVGAITKIELLHGTDTPVEAATLETRTFTGLLSNNAYTVKVTYTYNLNDGVGNQTKTANLLIWTAPTLSFTQASCANTGPVSKGETIYFEASVNNPNNVSFTKVKINGQYYNVSSGTSYTEIIVNMTVEEQFEGGNTDLTVTEIVGTLNGFERKIDVSENNTASVFVNGELNVLSIKIVDENGREGEVSYQSEGNYYIVELANRTGYFIESISINTYYGESRDYSYPYTIDQNTLKIRADLSLGYNNAEVTSITYSNESVGQKTKAIEGITINSIICLTNPTPIVISNATDLKNMDDWGYYVLENDIDLLGTVGNEWLNPGCFRGLFDGQGHKIVNMKFGGTIENEDLTWGLFSNASGIIRNVIVSGRLLVTITGGSAYTGGVAVGVDNVLSMNNVGNDVNISINNISEGSMEGTVDNSFWRIGNIYYARVNGVDYERATLQEVIDLLEPVWDETVWNFGETGLPVAKERYTITYNNLEGAQNNLDNLLIYTTRNEEIALLAPKKIGSIFLGWYEDELMNGSAVTDIPIGEYGDLQYYAKWEVCVLHTLDENCVCTICGAITHNKGIDGSCTVCEQHLYVRDGSYIWFGEYPQTIATSEAIAQMGTTADSKGYFTSSYDNERYAKVVATPYQDGYTFSDTSSVTEGNTYYFKVETIKWRILSESGGNALILCESIIANRRFDDRWDNNYAASEVRAWLNDQFYNTAFNTVQRALIKTTEVDNSVYSTGYDTNPNACTNTNDKIFLPSFRDVTNTAYGFNADGSTSDTARTKTASDYTRATGVYYYSEGGFWWLRSPYYVCSSSARFVYNYGNVNYFSVYYTFLGLVPALTISLN